MAEQRAVEVRGQMLQQDAVCVEGRERDLHWRIVMTLPAGKRGHTELLRVEGHGVVGAVTAAHAHLTGLTLKEDKTEQHHAGQWLCFHVVLADEGRMSGIGHALQRADIHSTHRLALLAGGGVVPHEVEVNHGGGDSNTLIVFTLCHDDELVLLVEGAAVVRLAGEGRVDRVDLQQPGNVGLVREAERRIGTNTMASRPGDEVVIQGTDVTLAQICKVIDIEALEVQLLLAMKGRVARAVWSDCDGTNAVLCRLVLQKLL